MHCVAKGSLLASERCPFTVRKAMFCSAKGHLLHYAFAAVALQHCCQREIYLHLTVAVMYLFRCQTRLILSACQVWRDYSSMSISLFL